MNYLCSMTIMSVLFVHALKFGSTLLALKFLLNKAKMRLWLGPEPFASKKCAL